MQRWLCFFIVNECVGVHNELKAQRRDEARARQERKRARVEKASESASLSTCVFDNGSVHMRH